MEAHGIRPSSPLITPLQSHALHTRLSLLVLLASLLLLLGACGSDPSEQEYLESANDAFLQQDYPTSVISVKNALRKNPDNAEARFLLGRIYLETSQGEAALGELQRAATLGLASSTLAVPLARALLLTRQFDEVLATRPDAMELDEHDTAYLHALRGYAFIAKKDARSARAEFDAALKLQPSLTQAALGHVRLSLAERNLQDAQQRISRLQAAFPDQADVHALAGEIALLSNDRDTAESAFTAALRIAPENGSVLEKRALLRLAENQLDFAWKDLQTLQKLAPTHPRTLYVLGLYQYMKGQRLEAKATLEQVLSAEPQNTRATFLLGLTDLALGNDEQALSNLERYAAQVPNSLPANKTLAVLYLKQGNFKRADDLLEKLLQGRPTDSTIINLAAKSAMRQGRVEQALALLQEAQKLAPDSTELQLSLGLSLVQSGEADQALSIFDKLLTVDPNSEQALRGLALAQLEQGDVAAALASARELAERHPSSAPAHTLLGALHIAAGEEQQAKAAFTEALAQDPGYPPASHSLALLAQKDGDAVTAGRYYRKALEHHPGDSATLVRLALLEQTNGQTLAAEEHLQQAIETDPNNIVARLYLTRRYTQKRSLSEARAVLADSPAAIREHPAILTEYARVLTLNGETGSAIDTLRTLVTEQPGLTAAWIQLGLLNEKIGDTDGAATAFTRAMQTTDQNSRDAVTIARGLYRTGRTDLVREQFASLKQAQPEDVNVKLLEGWLEQQAGNHDAAVQIYAQIHSETRSTAAVLALADATTKAGKPAKALKVLEKWVAENPQDKQASIGLAQLYLAQLNVPQATQALERLLTYQPADKGLLNDLGWLLRKDDPQAALAYAEKAHRIDPASPTILDTLGTLAMHAGDTARSVQLLTRAVEGNPHNPTIRFHLAQALLADKQPARAKDELDELLRTQSSFDQRQAVEDLRRQLESR